MLGDADGRSDLGQFVEVSVPGLFLIAEVHKASNVPLPVMSIRIHGNGGRRWLNELAGYAEGVPLRIGNLMLSDISVRTPVEGQALVGLLQQALHRQGECSPKVSPFEPAMVFSIDVYLVAVRVAVVVLEPAQPDGRVSERLQYHPTSRNTLH